LKAIRNVLQLHLYLHQKELVYEQTKSKDKEVSGLHKEINNRLTTQGNNIDKLTELVESHHDLITEIRSIIKTSGYIKKGIIWILVFVPTISAFLAGLRYIYDVTIQK